MNLCPQGKMSVTATMAGSGTCTRTAQSLCHVFTNILLVILSSDDSGSGLSSAKHAQVQCSF